MLSQCQFFLRKEPLLHTRTCTHAHICTLTHACMRSEVLLEKLPKEKYVEEEGTAGPLTPSVPQLWGGGCSPRELPAKSLFKPLAGKKYLCHHTHGYSVRGHRPSLICL